MAALRRWSQFWRGSMQAIRKDMPEKVELIEPNAVERDRGLLIRHQSLQVRCPGLLRVAGADDSEAAFRKLVNCERAAMRSDIERTLVQAHAILCSLLPG
jgi:hypothetical protein